MNTMDDPIEFQNHKILLRHAYEAWKASFTNDEREARLDGLYGSRDSEGRRYVRIEMLERT